MQKSFYEPYVDSRGWLTPIEFKTLPFEPKRIFIVSKVPPGIIRGEHSHFETKQYLICLDGEIEVIIHDGIEEKRTLLKQNESILIPELIWDSQKFISEDSKLLVICSTEYSKDDYIFDFDEFIKIKKTKENEGTKN